jgi:predicted AlkP superfamily pyrophosphatase or phosphodiesterase
MILPDYKGGSIVNLMSSILTSFGGRALYEPLRILPPDELKEKTNVVLLVLDGLGYEYLMQQKADTVFHKYLRGSITSVFPSTTPSCVTTFATGVAPQQHGVIGWYMYLRELAMVTAIIHGKPRIGGEPFSANGISYKSIIDYPGIYDQIPAQTYWITNERNVDSDFAIAMGGSARRLSYTTLSGCLSQVSNVINSNTEKKYVYAYWYPFDGLSHEYGVNSDQVASHFQELAIEIGRFVETLEGTDTALIITADHGSIDTQQSRVVDITKYPEIREKLILPLTGDSRAAYCYLKNGTDEAFIDYVREKIGDKVDILRSEELLEKNYFGLYEPRPQIKERIGNYVLLPKRNFIIKDYIGIEQKGSFTIGNHGGLSKDEMLVPLIVIKG